MAQIVVTTARKDILHEEEGTPDPSAAIDTVY